MLQKIGAHKFSDKNEQRMVPMPGEERKNVNENNSVDSPSQQRVSSRSFFSPITNWLYEALKLHKLLITSSVISSEKTISYGAISTDQMICDDISQIDDAQLFQIGFTRKYCSYTGITHTSLAFRNPETGKFLILGRQNNQFLKPNRLDAEISYSRWVATYLMNISTLFHFTETHMDNEMKYHFFPGTFFNAEISSVTLSGEEIKVLMKNIDEKICLAQRYDIVHSNCYSAVIFGLTQAIFIINGKSKEEWEVLADTKKDLTGLFTVLCQTLQDNYRMGSGTVNNSVVNMAVLDTIEILKKQNIFHISRDRTDFCNMLK
jgi:hypothetical protein